MCFSDLFTRHIMLYYAGLHWMATTFMRHWRQNAGHAWHHNATHLNHRHLVTYPEGEVDLLKLRTDRFGSLVSPRQWFSPTNISPHVHLQQKSGAKVKHLESSHELTAETLKLFDTMLLMGADILVTWWCFAAINISFYLAQVLLSHCYNFITQLLFLLWIWNETMR